MGLRPMSQTAHSAALTRPCDDCCPREGCPRHLDQRKPHSARCRMLSWSLRQGDLFPGLDKPAPPPTGPTLRDKALGKVLRRKFRERAFAVIRGLPRGEWEWDDIRLAVEAAGVVPHHHNAWGGLGMAARSRGLLRDTGRRTPARDPRKHAHANPVYEIRGGGDD